MVKLKILNKDGSEEKTIDISSKQSVLDEMLDNDSKIIFGCFGGSCGSCKCRIISGEKGIEKEGLKKIILKDLNTDEFLPCVAKVKDNYEEEIIIQKFL